MIKYKEPKIEFLQIFEEDVVSTSGFDLPEIQINQKSDTAVEENYQW